MVAKRNSFLETQRRIDEWRELRQIFHQSRTKDLIFIIANAMKKGVPEADSNEQLYFSLARQAVVKLLEMVKNRDLSSEEVCDCVDPFD
jgi:hypothetical protein